MKLNIIIFKNVKINAFTTPNFTDLEPDVAATQLERSLILHQEDAVAIAPYSNLDMYCIGQFDDQTGAIVQHEPVLLFSPRELILTFEVTKVAAAKKAEAEKNDEVA